MLKKSRGFSLVEMMLTVAVLAIMTAAAVPSYQLLMENVQVRSTGENLIAGLTTARSEALKRNTSVKFRLLEDNSWVVECANVVPNCPGEIKRMANDKAPYAKVITYPDDARQITFNNMGMRSLAYSEDSQADMFEIESKITNSSARKLRIETGDSGYFRLCDRSITKDGDPRKCQWD